ncbi:hypothetical protein SAMD00019534_085990 [Acytostelium subglobosum LB1]|uniref:hypothetical protein n=1 Tax=Acytostelium subglobosum LB1 TaxID=1410327 RepID=UPI000644AEC3|nr:hypothetical protein SAMD00019534_085990 [Acytostelium subglobosum LB1]GAM25424.1 hypothetical protein SAMD00019534_085990 [Acytostelium subglobosum LB1]|eukprot:XP_012751410.1 hypothetical protein SAMD00019534_085990 [Acytostelium subglobosum LB1]
MEDPLLDSKLPDLYDYLGIPNDASDEQIKKAYRQLAKKYHPDKPNGSHQKFQELNAVYEILSDPHKRATYDHFKRTGVKLPTMANPDDPMAAVFLIGASIGTLYAFIALSVSIIFGIPLTIAFFPGMAMFATPSVCKPDARTFAFTVGGAFGMVAMPLYFVGIAASVGKKLIEAPYNYLNGVSGRTTDKTPGAAQPTVLVLDENDFEFISKQKAEYEKIDEIERNWTFLSSDSSDPNCLTQLIKRSIDNITEMLGVIFRHYKDRHPSLEASLILKKIEETEGIFKDIDALTGLEQSPPNVELDQSNNMYPVLDNQKQQQGASTEFKLQSSRLERSLSMCRQYIENNKVIDHKSQIRLLSLVKNIEIFLEEYIFNSFEYYQI